MSAALAIWTFLKSGLSTIVGALGKLDVWQLLLIVAMLCAGVQTLRLHSEQRHSAKIEAQLTDLHNQLQAEKKAIEQANASNVAMAAQLRRANDENLSRIAGDAGALRVSGPGKSACRPLAPAASGGHDQAPAEPGTAGLALPPADLSAVPWNWLVTRAEEHDRLLAEEQAWRNWYAALMKSWSTTGATAK